MVCGLNILVMYNLRLPFCNCMLSSFFLFLFSSPVGVQPSSEASVTGYRVGVTTTPPQSIIVTGTTFTLDADYCNGTYQYSVTPVNECNIGSTPTSVSFTCGE